LLNLGGTELDDWPGGIKQKYLTLYPMIIETMKELKFSPVEINKREYMGGEIGEDGKGYLYIHIITCTILYIYIYIYIYMHIYIYICIYVYIYIFVHIYMETCKYVRIESLYILIQNIVTHIYSLLSTSFHKLS
jgi:hypothetical protein